MTNPYTEPFNGKPPLVNRQCWPDVSKWTVRWCGMEFTAPTLDHALNAACHAALDAQERGRE